MSKNISKKDIAIIGMSGVFPGSENIKQLWENLTSSKELIHFYSDEELNALGIDPKAPKNTNKVYTDASMPDADAFDYSFFNFSKEEAIYMDPQTRKFFELTWTAIEDAGYCIEKTDQKIGVFAAASDNLNWRAFANFSKTKTLAPFYLGQISNKNYLNTLLSYKLDLKGPSYNINTACSSSLSAVHLACRHLLLRECSMAVAGGIRITTTTDTGYEYQDGMIFSKDGYCRAFDAEASGAVFGEGAGVVILKRLEDAYADKDHIYAVIKASSTNNDGANKIGFTAPSIEGQYNCIRQAHEFATVDPATISFIEAHGTGTNLGDGIEVEALNLAFKSENQKSCALGSIKTNMGHLDAASGVTGLIKASLSVQNKLYPASLHYNTPNENIKFEKGPFYVNTENVDLQHKTNIRGAVSSFGMGGTNAHVLVEEAPSYDNKPAATNGVDILPFSAKSAHVLENYANSIQDFIKTQQPNSADLCYTFKTGRSAFDYRGFFLLNENGIIGTQIANTAITPKEVSFLFPGQGTQFAKMGAYLYQTETHYKEWIDKGLTFLKNTTGEDYRDILFEENMTIHQTKYTQPLVFLVEFALAKTLIHFGITPKTMIGHSLGEYVAAAISCVFTFEEGLQLIIKRAALMDKVEEGSMLAAQGELKVLKEIVPENIEVAAVNTSKSIVFSGTNEEIIALKKVFTATKIKNKILNTSHAFHSKSMDVILSEFEAEFNSITLKEPTISYVSNSTGKLITKEEATSVAYWVGHLRNTVNFKDGIDTLLQNNNTVFVEIGAGATLLNMVREESKEKVTGFATIAHVNEQNNDQQKLQTLFGQLWLHGITANWETFYADKTRYKITAPTYPFEKVRFPVKVNPLEKQSLSIEVVTHDFQINTTAKKAGTKEIIKPQNEIQERLAAIWQDFFETTEISMDDDYFELGGNSLQAVVIVNRINQEFDTNLSIESMYNHLTIKDLSELLAFSIQQTETETETEIEVEETDEFVI